LTRAPRRLIAFLATAFAAIAFSVSAAPLPKATATGSYLAGQQALVDLRTSEAASYLEKAARADWDNPIIVERAFMALAADARIEDAAEMGKHLLELDPSSEFARLVIAAVDLKERRYDAVVDGLAGIGIETYPGLAATILRGWGYVGDYRAAEAETLLKDVGDEGLADFLVFHRALMADLGGNTDLALALAGEAYKTDSAVPRMVEAYARMLGNAGRLDDARKVVADFALQGLSHPLVDQVKAYLDQGQRPGLFAPSPQAGAAEMLYSLGVALSREPLGDYAAVFLRLGIYLDPDSHLIAMALAQLFDWHEQYKAANTIYEGIPPASPMKPLAVVRVAGNLDALGDRPGAIRELNAIIGAHPDDLEAVSVLGDLYRDDEKFAEAADAYTRALAITGGTSPADWRFYYVRGIAYERNKEWPKAEADFQMALKLNPDQPDVLNYLGYSWVDQGINLQPALAMIEKAVAAAPNNGYIVDSLGWAFYRLGRFEEAVKTLEQAVQLLPNDPEINDHLGDAYWRTGRELEARFQWNVASAMDKQGNVKARVMPKLANGLDGIGAVGQAETPASQASTQ
jgi:tetratricopeptide (TPR) repeat protein